MIRDRLEYGELKSIIHNLAQQEFVFPNSKKGYIGEKTIEDWYYAWRRNGLVGLTPKIRNDRGQLKIDPILQASILDFKRLNPNTSIRKIIKLLSDDVALNVSSVHRLLQANHLSNTRYDSDKQFLAFNDFFNEASKRKSSLEDLILSHQWMLNLIQGQYDLDFLKSELDGSCIQEEINELLHYIIDDGLVHRNRAVTVLAYLKNISKIEIAQFLGISLDQVNYILDLYTKYGTHKLFGKERKGRARKYENTECKYNLFALLHSPPRDHDINRTTWTLRTLSAVLKKQGFLIGIGTISKIIKDAGFRFRHSKKVLTSTDPRYKIKLHEITKVLSCLGLDEKFFSVDEYGPFSIKKIGGVSLVKQDQLRIVPQYQKSKGSVIVTAALELSENQITHFFSQNKNSDEMMKLILILILKYSGQSRLYISWDAASWHISNKVKD